MTGVVVVKKNSVLVVKRSNQVVVIKETVARVISAGVRLVQNIYQGGDAMQYPAGENLGGHRMVVLNDSQQAIYAVNTTLTHANKVLGMTTGAAALGGMATVQTGGEITEPSWGWVLDQPIYLGINGLLTQTPPIAGFSLIIGFPITATKIFINLREPLILN